MKLDDGQEPRPTSLRPKVAEKKGDQYMKEPRTLLAGLAIWRVWLMAIIAVAMAAGLLFLWLGTAHAESAAAVVPTYWVGSGQNEPVWTLTRITNFLTNSPDPGTIYGIMVWEDQGNHDLVVRGFRFDNKLVIMSEKRIRPGTKLSLSYGIHFLPGGLGPIQFSLAFWHDVEGWKGLNATLLPDWQPDRTIEILEDSITV